MRTIAGHSIVEYQEPEEWAGEGIILPSAMKMREILKMRDHNISADDIPPDVYRFGRLVAGELKVPNGYLVLFNRHDSEEFKHEGKTYHRINDLNALAYVDPQTVDH